MRLREHTAPFWLKQDALDDLWPHTVGFQVFDRGHDAEFAQRGNPARNDIALTGIGS